MTHRRTWLQASLLTPFVILGAILIVPPVVANDDSTPFENLVWRAIATAALSNKPGKNDKKLEKAIAKIAKQWDKSRGYYLKEVRKIKATEREQQEQ